MDEKQLALYWDDIPIGKNKAVTYPYLMELWGKNDRAVRLILHELSGYDNGDNYILLRSASSKGFYRTDDAKTIEAYKRECLNKGRSVFAPLKKINRVLAANGAQFTLVNNMRFYREHKGLKQTEVSAYMRQIDTAVDNALISRFENGVCLPTPSQLAAFAQLYECDVHDLINTDFYI